MASDVKVKIDLSKPAVKLGFGVPLLLEESAATDKEYTECKSLEDVVNAGFGDDTKIYRAAKLMFMQDGAMQTIAVCAAAEKAEVWLAKTENTSKSWRQLIVVNETGRTNIQEIMDVTEKLDGKMYFASLPVTDNTKLTVSNIDRTVLFYCSAQNEVIADGRFVLTGGEYTNSDYKGVQLVSGEVYLLTVDGITVFAEAESADGYTSLTNGTVTVKTKNGELTVSGVGSSVYDIEIIKDTSGYEVAALVGATAGQSVGSYTYKNQILKGIKTQSLNDTELNAIHAKGGITFVEKAGDNVTSEGKTAGGEYIDIIDSRDYVIQQLEYQTQKLLNTSGKIPYDNNGIAMLESVAVNVMKDCYNSGIIATGEDGKPACNVSYGKRENTDASDRLNRNYVEGRFSFSLAGAVHEVEITGEIII